MVDKEVGVDLPAKRQRAEAAEPPNPNMQETPNFNKTVEPLATSTSSRQSEAFK
jgi:hypothetical protein